MNKIGRTIKRRRRENKTDYKARLALLKDGKARLIIRRTNKFIIGQIVESEIAQDKVILGVSSKDLLGYGWPSELKGSLKNLAASYLTGFLMGTKIKDREVIVDFGLQRNIHKGRLYAFLKGAIDAGMKINCGEENLPEEDAITKKGKLVDIINKIKEKLS